MSSKEQILQRIKEHTLTAHPMPDFKSIHGTVYPDRTDQFIQIMKLVGGDALVVKEDEDLNETIQKLYPNAKRIGSVLPQITCATFNPNDTDNPAELDGTDLAVIEGVFGVAENGAIWIEQNIKQRALYFISENLVILLKKSELVNNMHEAYSRINNRSYDFGVFISGPSKTADIEQALVIGAHGAKGVTVLLI